MTENSIRWPSVRAAVIIALALAYFYLVLFYDPEAAIVSLLSDDAFYYLNIAKNISRGMGPTFDGLAQTNGFHPLWMIIVSFIYRVFGTDLQTPVRVVMAVNAVLGIATLWLVYRLANRFIAPGFGWLAVAACLLPNVLSAMVNGMETGLLLLMVTWTLWLCCKYRIHDPRSNQWSALLFGALLGVVCLCRLDAAFVFASAFLITFVAGFALGIRLRLTVRRLFLLSFGFSIPLAPYFCWNLVSFGHIMPISGGVKSSFPAIRDHLNLYGDMRFAALLLVAMLGLLVVIEVFDIRRREETERKGLPLLVGLLLACLFHFLHAFLFLSWGFYWWHFSIYGLTLSLLLARAAYSATRSRAALRPVLVAAIGLPLAAFGLAFKLHEVAVRGAQHATWLRAAEWVRQNTEIDDVLGIKDAGLFGYFSERHVINLDGKANGYEYLEHIARGDAEGYLRDIGLKYIADIGRHCSGNVCTIPILRANREPLLLLMSRDSEVYRGELTASTATRFGRRPSQQIVIWKYSASAN